MTEKLNWGLYLNQKIIHNNCEKFTLRCIKNFSGLHLLLCDYYEASFPANNCKPILRSLDQMTEDEKQEYAKLFCQDESWTPDKFIIKQDEILVLYRKEWNDYIYNIKDVRKFDWLTAKGFSIRGEIENGLAIKEVDK